MKKIKFTVSKELVENLIVDLAQDKFPDYDIHLLTKLQDVNVVGYKKDKEECIYCYTRSGIMVIDD